MKRPKRLSYPNGIYGDLDYERALEKYCSHLEKKLAIHPDLEREKEEFAIKFTEWFTKNTGRFTDDILALREGKYIELYKNRDNEQ